MVDTTSSRLTMTTHEVWLTPVLSPGSCSMRRHLCTTALHWSMRRCFRTWWMISASVVYARGRRFWVQRRGVVSRLCFM